MVSVVRLTSFLGPIASRAGPLVKDYDHLVIQKGTKGVWIPPTPHLVVGEVKKWAEAGNIHATRIPGYWYDRKGHDIPIGQRAQPGEKVVYMIHGGGFIGGTARPGLWGACTSRFTLCHPSIRRGFAVEYRITTGPPLELEHPFPTALIDTLAGYAYLIDEVGFAPEDIIVVGDSAGGNLALALVRYLIETRPNASFLHVPIPAPPLGLALLSPYADLGDSHDISGSFQQTNIHSDFLEDLNTPLFRYARMNYSHILGFPHGANTNRYLSPGSVHPNMEPVSFKGFPKTFITYGDAEILYDQCVTLEKKLVEDIGRDHVFSYMAKDACHDVMIADFWEPERTLTFEAAGRWLDTIIG